MFFFGDIFGKIFGPPSNLPEIKANESFIITPENKRNVKAVLRVESKFLKYISDIILPKIYNVPKNTQKVLLENTLTIFTYSLNARTKQAKTKRLNKII